MSAYNPPISAMGPADPSNVLVLHDTDYDGMGAAYAAWAKFGDQASYVGLSGSDRDEVRWEAIPDEPRHIYLLDWPSWPLDDLFEIAQTHELAVIDHHESWIKELKEVGAEPLLSDPSDDAVPAYETFNTNAFQTRICRGTAGPHHPFTLVYAGDRAACTLAWEFFHQSQPPTLIQHLEDYDLWNWAMDGTDEATAALDAEGLSVETIDRYVGRLDELKRIGGSVTSYRDSLIEKSAGHVNVEEAELAGETQTVGFLNASLLRSMTADEVFAQTGADVVWIYSVDGRGPDAPCYCSIRTRDGGPNAGEIASRHGGGGHANAAGCRMSYEELSSL